MAFIKKTTTTPNRTSLLLQFDIQFQAAQIEELQHRVLALTSGSNGILNVSKFTTEQHAHARQEEMLKNLTTIHEIRSNIFTDTDSGSDSGNESWTELDKYLLCRVITPLIPTKCASTHEKETAPAQTYICVIDESETYNCLWLELEFQPQGPVLSIAESSRALPIGSVLLIKNPSNFYYPNSTKLKCDFGDVILFRAAADLARDDCGHLEWKSKLPLKYTKVQQKDPSASGSVPVQDKSPQCEHQSRTGLGYPIHEWLTAETPASLQRLDCAEYEGPVHVQVIPGKGRGLVASEFIPRGTLILAKRAFVVSFVETELVAVTGSNAVAAHEMSAFNAWTDELNANKIARRLASEPESGKDVYGLYAGPKFEGKPLEDTAVVDMDRIMEICKYNGIANRPCLSSKTPQGQDCQLFTQQMTTGLWIRPAYINHSCSDANVFWRIWGDFLFVRSFADIQPGQEILMSYRGGLTQCPYLERRSALFNGMGFQCDCTLCYVESKFGKNVNQNIADLVAEVQTFALHLNGLGSAMYRLTLLSIIDDIKATVEVQSTSSSLGLLEVYLYQPYKLLAMTLLAEAQDLEANARTRGPAAKLRQAVVLLEKAHDLIQNTCDCGKSVGCSLDLIAIHAKLNEGAGVQKWLAVLKSNLRVVYGCSEPESLDVVLDLFLKQYKINRKAIHC